MNAGQDTPMDLLRARRTAKQIELAELQLDDDTAALSDRLLQLMGLPPGSLQTVSSSIPALPTMRSLEATAGSGVSPGVQAAFENAQSKQEYAFGMGRYLLRPQIGLGLNYSRIDTGQNDYTTYYPNFKGKSENAASVYLSLQIPIYDRKHRDESRQAEAEATRARFDALDQRNQFLTARSKLRHSTAELSTRSELAEIDRDLAQEQLNAILVQLSDAGALPGRPVMTPKDEQNARLQERERAIDLLDAQNELTQAEIKLLSQSGQLNNWIGTRPATAGSLSSAPTPP
jgi:outer membrane protein TolC